MKRPRIEADFSTMELDKLRGLLAAPAKDPKEYVLFSLSLPHCAVENCPKVAVLAMGACVSLLPVGCCALRCQWPVVPYGKPTLWPIGESGG